MRDSSSVCDVCFSMVDEFLQLRKDVSLLFTLYYLYCKLLRGPSPIALGNVKIQISIFLSAFPKNKRQKVVLKEAWVRFFLPQVHLTFWDIEFTDKWLMIVCLTISVVLGILGFVALLGFLLTLSSWSHFTFCLRNLGLLIKFTKSNLRKKDYTMKGQCLDQSESELCNT